MHLPHGERFAVRVQVLDVRPAVWVGLGEVHDHAAHAACARALSVRVHYLLAVRVSRIINDVGVVLAAQVSLRNVLEHALVLRFHLEGLDVVRAAGRVALVVDLQFYPGRHRRPDAERGGLRAVDGPQLSVVVIHLVEGVAAVQAPHVDVGAERYPGLAELYLHAVFFSERRRLRKRYAEPAAARAASFAEQHPVLVDFVVLRRLAEAYRYVVFVPECSGIDGLADYLLRCLVHVLVVSGQVDVVNAVIVLLKLPEHYEPVRVRAVLGVPGALGLDYYAQASAGKRAELGERVCGDHAVVVLIVEVVLQAVVVALRIPEPQRPLGVGVVVALIVYLHGVLAECRDLRWQIHIPFRVRCLRRRVVVCAAVAWRSARRQPEDQADRHDQGQYPCLSTHFPVLSYCCCELKFSCRNVRPFRGSTFVSASTPRNIPRPAAAGTLLFFPRLCSAPRAGTAGC